MTQCWNCDSPNVITEQDVDGDTIERCLACGRRRTVQRQQRYQDYEGVEARARKEREKENNRLPSSLTSQQRATKRYRKSQLFKLTNNRIQARYRKSETYIENQSRKKILNRMANRVAKIEPGICPEHGKPIMVSNNGTMDKGYCLVCLNQKHNW